MSFYGNVYYLAEQAFAKYAFRNSGYSDIIFPAPGQEVNRVIDASDSNQGLSIDTGNRWIVLTNPKEPYGDSNGYRMWHNSPDTNNLSIVDCVSVSDTLPPEVSQSDVIPITFEQYIKTAVVAYDEAGHVSVPQGITYYQMPTDPTEWLKDRMNDIDGLDNNPDTSSLKYQLTTRMNDIDGLDNNPDTSSLKYQLFNRMESIDGPDKTSLKNVLLEEIGTIQNSVETINELAGFVRDGWKGEFGNELSLMDRMKSLENRVVILEGRI